MAEGEDFANDLLLTKQGRMQFGIELRIIDGDGTPLPWDGEQAGALQVRGPWVVDRYFPDFEGAGRSEEHTSELQSLMRISYAVFCLKKKKEGQTRRTDTI